MIIKILDVVSSLLILIGLWNVIHNRKWWLVYIVGSILFIIVTISKGLPGLFLMGIATTVMAVKNYIKSGKQEKESIYCPNCGRRIEK